MSTAAASVELASLGKPALMSAGRSARLKTRPPRGPRSVLCVVVVTMSAWPNGVGWSPAATRPAMWAMSTMSRAPTDRAIRPMRSKSMMRG